jgi:hypothetical protein
VVEAGRMAAPWFARLVVGAHVLVANEPAHRVCIRRSVVRIHPALPAESMVYWFFCPRVLAV